jgi:hypothetical protein
MKLRRTITTLGAGLALLMACAGVARADQYIDFGTNQDACKSAAQQAGNGSYCYQTGPGHYSLYYKSRTSY